MTTSQADTARPADPMRGPDFVMARVASWVEQAGADSVLRLRDGSVWRVDPRRPDYAVQAAFIAAAMSSGEDLLVTGKQRQSSLERSAATRRLAVQRIGAKEIEGRYSVLFYGPPSVYYLRMARPDAAQALALLRQSAASGAFIDTPDLLVGIDTVVSEVVAVRPLALDPVRVPRCCGLN